MLLYDPFLAYCKIPLWFKYLCWWLGLRISTLFSGFFRNNILSTQSLRTQSVVYLACFVLVKLWKMFIGKSSVDCWILSKECLFNFFEYENIIQVHLEVIHHFSNCRPSETHDVCFRAEIRGKYIKIKSL